MLALLAPKPFADVCKDPVTLHKVTQRFLQIITESFLDPENGRMRKPTDAEVKRRFGILEKWFRDMRGERQWTVDRCLDCLPQALTAELAGRIYEPDKRSLWVPRDGA